MNRLAVNISQEMRYRGGGRGLAVGVGRSVPASGEP